MNACILMTATVRPFQGMTHTVLTDSNARLEQYLDAIRFTLLQTDLPVVVVENSGFDLSPFFKKDIAEQRIEILSFDGSQYDTSKGKGIGEWRCLEYFFAHAESAQTCDFTLKITGRLQLNNLKRLLQSAKNNCIVADYNHRDRYADARCFIVKRTFMLYFRHLAAEMDDKKGIYFEHILYRALQAAKKDGQKIALLPQKPRLVGQSGSYGTRYVATGRDWYIQQVKQQIKRLLYVIR